MQAISTKYVGPTNYRGSRIIASCEALRRTFAWNYALGVEENHRAAALALVAELGWLTESRFTGLASGSIDIAPARARYAHVLVTRGCEEKSL